MQRLSDELRTSLERMCATYQDKMTSEGLEYLYSRGLDDSAIESFRLGVVARGGEHSEYAGMLSIPYVTELAGVVGFKFRKPHACTDDCQHQKYITPYPVRLFNTPDFAKAERLGYIAITEGEFDAMVLSGMCNIPAVAVPGVDAWTNQKSWPLVFQGIGRVLIFKDNDQDRTVTVGGKEKIVNPGRDLARRIRSDVPNSVLVDTEGLGKDVNEIFLGFGADTIRELAEV